MKEKNKKMKRKEMMKREEMMIKTREVQKEEDIMEEPITEITIMEEIEAMKGDTKIIENSPMIKKEATEEKDQMKDSEETQGHQHPDKDHLEKKDLRRR